MGYQVKPITRKDCEPFIIGIHYAHRWPSISYAFGLFCDGDLVGVVTYGTPPSRHAQIGACADRPDAVIELNRLCLLHNRKNEASLLVGRSLKMLPPSIVISYADTAQGHKGYVYRAANFFYAGWTDMDRKTARIDYVVSGKHSRDAFRGGAIRNGVIKVRRKPKVKYWTVTGSKSQKSKMRSICLLPIMDWNETPPPSKHKRLNKEG